MQNEEISVWIEAIFEGWFLKFDEFMNGQEYLRSQFDHCVYYKRLHNEFFIYLLLYVDECYGDRETEIISQ